MMPTFSYHTKVNVINFHYLNDFTVTYQCNYRKNWKSLLAYESLLSFIILCFFSSVTPAQTTVVATRTNRDIVIAADSLIVNTTRSRNEKGELQKSETRVFKCKIVHAAGVYFALAGFRTIDGTDIATFGIRACENGKTLRDKARLFAEYIKPLAERTIEAVRQLDMDFYRTHYGAEPISAVFAGIENGQPMLVHQVLRTLNLPSEPVRMESIQYVCPGDCPSDPDYAMIAFLGHHEAIDGYDKNAGFWQRFGFVNGTRRLVEIQIRAKPSEVGGTIHVLQLNTKGARWHGPHPNCPDIKSEQKKPTTSRRVRMRWR